MYAGIMPGHPLTHAGDEAVVLTVCMPWGGNEGQAAADLQTPTQLQRPAPADLPPQPHPLVRGSSSHLHIVYSLKF